MRACSRNLGISSCLFLLAGLTAQATIFTVTTTADTGAGSLRGALMLAQNCAGAPHTIAFNIPVGSLTAGVAVITPASALPTVTCAGTTIDGTTQTINVGNTNNVTLGTGGTVGTGADGRPGTGDEPALPQLNGPEVEIIGSAFTQSVLTLQADDVVVRGLALHGGGAFGGSATGNGNIDVEGGNGVLIEKNVLGTTATSFTNPGGAAQTQDNLVRLNGGSNITIQQNLLGFPRWRGVMFINGSVSGATIQQNEFAGGFVGIDFCNPGCGPGGTATITRNLFRDTVDNGSGSNMFGVFLTQTGGSASITDNTFSNVGYGVLIDVARPVLVQHNIISNGSGAGVDLFQASTSMPTTITQNSIASNGLLGIGFSGAVTPTANDACDTDTGPNNLQNYPVLTTASSFGGNTNIQGTLNSVANMTYQIEFFANASCDPSLFGEGQTYLGSTMVTTDGSCNGSFNVNLPVSVSPQTRLTATATDPAGNTSEFSACTSLQAQYHTVTPCRVADTRGAAGPYGAPALAANADRTFVVGGQCGIPVTAQAVAFNFTITLPTALGDLRTFPGGGSLPLVSTMNWRPGQTRANNAIVPLGPSGDVVVHVDQASGTVQFIIDVNGYFE